MNKYESINGLWKVKYKKDNEESKNFDEFIRIDKKDVFLIERNGYTINSWDYFIINLYYGSNYKILNFDLLLRFKKDMIRNKVSYQLSIESTKNLDTGFEILTMKGKTSTEHYVAFTKVIE